MKSLFPAAFAACLALSPSLLNAAPAADISPGAAASYQFTLGKLLAVEGSINDALAAYEQAEKLAIPESTQTAYIYVEHAQLLARMAQYLRLDSLGKMRSSRNPTSGRNRTTSRSVIARLPLSR